MRSRYALAGGIIVIANSSYLLFSMDALPVFVLFALLLLAICWALDAVYDRRREGDG